MAEKLIEFGAIPITFSDSTGCIYEPGGFDITKLRTVQKIKTERGARVGRYIMASTTAKFQESKNFSIYDIECDLIFPCSNSSMISDTEVSMLSSKGCQGIIEGVQQTMSLSGITAAKKRGALQSIAVYRCWVACIYRTSQRYSSIFSIKGFINYLHIPRDVTWSISSYNGCRSYV